MIEVLMGLLWTLLSITILTVPILIFGKKKWIKINAKQKRWWVISHVTFVIVYFTGVLGILFFSIFSLNTTDNELMYAAHYFMHNFDLFLIVPGALGSLTTGIWLAIGTWGLTTYYWVIAKWIGNMTTILFGSTFIGSWIQTSQVELNKKGIDPLQNPVYVESQKMIFIGIIIVFAILFFLTTITYLKPWGKRQKYRK
ncbi:hypothetical protein [Shimazuella kribbensis]|uniref:hypothetical protein n=1 Tax=Shimazuella kribbensis TaxID=139808 RepID=UPI000417F12E|nr:hypothetical protein [Shimazuella kribbensis]